jgi:flagellar biosynthesis protein FlhG
LFAFASGKGGVGKSLLLANLGIQLARQGRNVTLLDCDLASSTLHTYLGASPSHPCLDDLLSGRSSSLAALARETSVPGLRLIAGSRGGARAFPGLEELEALVLKAYELATDCVLIDLPSGRHPLSVEMLELADCGVLVTTPEPSSLEGGFRLMEELARRAIEMQDAAGFKAAESALGSGSAGRGPAAFLDSLADVDPALANRLAARLARLRLVFLVNQSRADGEAQSALNLRSLCRHYLGLDLEFGGAVEFDLSAWQATRQRKSLSQKYPNAPATRTIEQIATSLFARSGPHPARDPRWMRLSQRTLYEVLEVPPSASQRDLQRAYDRLQAIAGPEAEALGGAAHPERVRAVRARVETAYRTLVFLESRSEYDRMLLADNRVRPEELRDLSLEPQSAPPPGGPAQAGPAAAQASCSAPDSPAAAPATDATAGAAGGTAAAQPGAAAETSSAGAAAAPRADGSAPLASDATPRPDMLPLEASGTPLLYSGPVLAALRHERGLSLEAIGAVSKVRTTYLRSLEEERFGELPAPIFLKGFVREYARCLSLDPLRVWQDYQARYEEWRRSRGGS